VSPSEDLGKGNAIFCRLWGTPFIVVSHLLISALALIVGFINSGDALLGAISEPLIGKMLDLGWHHHTQQHARVFG